MKNFLISFLISFNTMASNWMPISKIQANSNQAYQLESDCLKSNEQCLDVGNEPEAIQLGHFSLSDVIGDDLNNPIYEAESQVEECNGQEECEIELANKECPQDYLKFIDIGYTRTYCTVITGYNQIAVAKSLTIDTSAFNAYKATKAAEAALASGKAQVKTLRECLAGVIDLMVLRNASKNLTTNQVENMVETYQPIMSLLLAASGITAKEKIQEVVADGVLITEGDKTALVQEIDGCLGI